ncbi:MAG: hypothetical protein JOY68_04910 [Candidatus Dormibacteraeota bacterium]|nr:hypothetical protein [Candidatus Dormibacteraeota bacterium]MBV8446128.1 hypothetical protein [Candidatus Dormibacteraeota bacterium]
MADRPRRHRPHLDPTGEVELPDDDEPSADRERFLAASTAALEDSGRPADREILAALLAAKPLRIAELTYGSNAVFLLELDAPDPTRDEPLRGIYKPMRGERPLWDFPRHTLYLREVAAYLVDAALGAGHVPPTVLRDGPLGPGSLQLYVHGLREVPAAGDTAGVNAQLHDIAVLDVLINNADRKRAHLLLGEDLRLRAIDNALSFLPYPRQRTALLSLGGSAVPKRSRNRLHHLADATVLTELCGKLQPLLSPRELAAFAARAREFDADPVYPVLDDWDGRPFEWW